MAENLGDLESKLKDLSHDDSALEIIREFPRNLGKTKAKQKVFNAKDALIRHPIFYQDLLDRNLIKEEEDPFILLQGDIISTDSAYFMGERLIDMKFAIASSTCDLVPKRRNYAALLRLKPITQESPNVKQVLGELLSFKSTKRMYLPPLPNDADDVIANALLFDGIVQIKLEDLLMATRIASLSLVGWRIFGSIVRNIMVRAGDSEVVMRQSNTQILHLIKHKSKPC